MPTTLLALPTKNNAIVPRSQLERVWLVGGAVATVVLIAVGYFLFIGPQRSETSDVRKQISDAQAQNSTLQARIDELRNQSKSIAKYRTDFETAQRALPSTSGLSDFVRSLQSLGAATSTSVSSLTVGQPTDVSTVAGAAPTAAGASPNGAAPSPARPSPSPSPARAGATPVSTGPKIYALQISAEVTGTPTALNQFLEQLQSVQPRAVLITALTENSGAGTPNTTVQGSKLSSATKLQITMQAFVAPTSPNESASLSAASR